MTDNGDNVPGRSSTVSHATQAKSMAGPRPAPYHLPLMLLGASVVLFFAVGIVHAGCALTGFLL